MELHENLHSMIDNLNMSWHLANSIALIFFSGFAFCSCEAVRLQVDLFVGRTERYLSRKRFLSFGACFHLPPLVWRGLHRVPSLP